MRDLTLNQAIDMCKASETAGQQLKEMATSEEVQLLKSEKQPHRRRGRGGRATVELEQLRRRTRSTSTNRRDRSAERSCRYCGRHHDVSNQSCPAFGQMCTKCHKRNHFASVCRSRPATTTPSHQQNVREIDETESLLALDNEGSKRVYSNVYVNDHKVRFVLDCGSAVNILPRSIVSAMGHSHMLRPARAMFDATELPTVGMITATLRRPRTGDQFDVDFT